MSAGPATATKDHVVQKLSWIKYHEVPRAGHLFSNAGVMAETLLNASLTIPQAS